MPPNFFQKELEDITFSDIKQLVDNRIPESYDLDYKQDYPKNKNLGKVMIGFSNTTGGYIIIGVKCKPNLNVPEKIIGVDKEEHSTRITQIAYSNSQPHIWPKIQVIPHKENSDKNIVVVKIKEAVEPIMMTRRNRFPIRINDKTEYADQSLVKKLFSEKNIYHRINEYREEMKVIEDTQFSQIKEKNTENRHALIGFSAIPFHRGDILLDLSDRETEHFLERLSREFSYGMYRSLPSFSTFLRNFNYMGDYYEAKLTPKSDNINCHSQFRIYQDGRIHCFIIFKTPKGIDLLKNGHKDYDHALVDEETAKQSSYLFHWGVPRFVISFLKLACLIYSQHFSGNINISIRFASSDYKLLMCINNFYLNYSHKSNIMINKTFYSRDLKDE